ncbi:MAG: MBL fold metallo-hydrolase [Chloroflexi bacterium]|nr:MBL fold metallo-hydrolase [Chloroflexota bacterium]
MKVKWLGHAAFLITSESGTRIITDPYNPGGPLKYRPIKEPADIVTMSHGHDDHNNLAAVTGSPAVVKSNAEVKGIKIKAIPAYHDEEKGAKRGANTIFCFETDGLRLCHLGDLGHPLSDQQVKEIGKVDVLLLPVGGFYTVEPPVAGKIHETLKPRVTIPMHFRSDSCEYPIAPPEEFLKGKPNVKRLNSSEVEFKAGSLPEQEIVVLQAALCV